MPIARLLAALILGLMLVPAVTPVVAEEPLSQYRLGVGDKLRITVFGHKELSGEFVVSGSGEVVMPLIQGVRGRGLTTAELARAIADRLRPDYLVNPRVSVELLGYRPFYILGEVQKPGDYPYVEGMSVLNAVALAGGFAPHARRDKVFIERGRGASRKKYKAAVTAPVRPGDIITVRERFF